MVPNFWILVFFEERIQDINQMRGNTNVTKWRKRPPELNTSSLAQSRISKPKRPSYKVTFPCDGPFLP